MLIILSRCTENEKKRYKIGMEKNDQKHPKRKSGYGMWIVASRFQTQLEEDGRHTS